jgi:hypothetical protein
MDGYLVVLRHAMDDYPIRLFADRDEAFAFAETADWLPDETIRRLFNGGGKSPSCFFVVEFKGGQPCDREVLDREASVFDID